MSKMHKSMNDDDRSTESEDTDVQDSVRFFTYIMIWTVVMSNIIKHHCFSNVY